jgi:ATP-dependent DNA helicase RecG
MVRTTDGFEIAEVDLRLRGPGDFFGTRQSGLPEFRVADVVADADLLQEARGDAFALVEEDPRLENHQHEQLARHLRSRYAEEMMLMDVG